MRYHGLVAGLLAAAATALTFGGLSASRGESVAHAESGHLAVDADASAPRLCATVHPGPEPVHSGSHVLLFAPVRISIVSVEPNCVFGGGGFPELSGGPHGRTYVVDTIVSGYWCSCP